MVPAVDPGLEEALSDRLSFRRFVGLALADPVPDHSTLSRFRAELVRRGLAEPLLAELNRQLDARGLMVRTGTLIDASLVEADGRRPRQGEPVEDRSDRDASWNAMPEQPLFGYKAHVAVDQGSGLVRQAILTPANVSDKTPFLALVQGDEQAVYADRGYDGWWYEEGLARRGIEDGIMACSYWRRPLDAAGRARNRAIAPLRAPVERTFAILKRWYGYRRVRYRSLARNGLQLQLLARRDEPAPRPGAGRLRAGSASGGRPPLRAPPAARRRRPGAPAHSLPFQPVPSPQGTNSAFTQSSLRSA